MAVSVQFKSFMSRGFLTLITSPPITPRRRYRSNSPGERKPAKVKSTFSSCNSFILATHSQKTYKSIYFTGIVILTTLDKCFKVSVHTNYESVVTLITRLLPKIRNKINNCNADSACKSLTRQRHDRDQTESQMQPWTAVSS